MWVWAIWHSGTMTWASGHLGLLENVQGSSDTSEMTLWHVDTLLACWHAGTVDRPMAQANQWWSPLSQSVDSDGTHRCGWFTGWWWCGCWCRWCLFWVRAGSKPVHTQKLAQPHKPKINPNFEIWNNFKNLDNLDNFVSFYG